MGSFLYYFETALALVVMFSVLVAAHEFGHYIFARLFNMGVEEFALGFGKKPLFQWMRRTYEVPLRPGEVPSIQHAAGSFDLESTGSRPAEDMVVVDTPSGQIIRETTRFTVRPWPLGGFVRIKGMLPEEDGSETTIAGGFYNKPPLQRLMVLFAGPLFSVLAGIFILVPCYMVFGIQQLDNSPIIGPVSKDGPAFKAGLKEHDRVTAIDGKPVATFYDINAVVRDSAGKHLRFDIIRDNKPLKLVVTPILDKVPGFVLGPDLKISHEKKRPQGKLMTSFVHHRVYVGFVKAFEMAIEEPIDAVMGLVDMFSQPNTIKDSVGGTISITMVTYDAVQEGIAPVIQLAALLSISVGILNLLPVVPLDGGQMAMAIAELLRGGKRLSMKVQSIAQMCGIAFMGVLIISVFFLDITRLFDRVSSPKDPPPKRASK